MTNSNFNIEVIDTSKNLINRMPKPILKGISPHQKHLGKKSEYTILRCFVYRCFPLMIFLSVVYVC